MKLGHTLIFSLIDLPGCLPVPLCTLPLGSALAWTPARPTRSYAVAHCGMLGVPACLWVPLGTEQGQTAVVCPPLVHTGIPLE